MKLVTHLLMFEVVTLLLDTRTMRGFQMLRLSLDVKVLKAENTAIKHTKDIAE